jgi:hypothetical protein
MAALSRLNIRGPVALAMTAGNWVASATVGLTVTDAAGTALPGRLAGSALVCMNYSYEDASGSVRGVLGLRIL